MEPPSSSSELLQSLSPDIATLWKQSRSSFAKGRRKELTVSGEDDFRTYTTVTSEGDAVPSSNSPKNLASTVIEKPIIRPFTKALTNGPTNRIAPSNAGTTPPETTTTPPPPTSTSSKSKSVNATRSSSSSSTWDTFDGYSSVYFHTSPPVLTPAFFDDAGPFFLFVGSGRSDAPSPSKQGETQVLGPSVLERLGTNEMVLLLYKRLQRNSRLVAEFISRVVRLEPGDEGCAAALYFEAVDEEQLGKEAFATVKEKRLLVQRDFDIVAAEELGCLVLVSRWSEKGTTRGTPPNGGREGGRDILGCRHPCISSPVPLPDTNIATMSC